MDKKLRYIELKAVDEEKKTVSAYVSTYDWDRMNEKFVKGAWRLDNYKKSPVVLWAHNYGRPPIAKALKIEEDDKGLMAEMIFDEQDEFAMKIFGMFRRGFLNSFSVGFKPNKYITEQLAGTEEKGIVWTDAELLEFSAVPVPANPQATMTRAEAEIMVKALPNFKIKEITGTDEVKLEEAIDKADWMVQSLIFPKTFWDSLPEARKWAEEHDYRTDKVDETEDSYRFRQDSPDNYSEFRTICINPSNDTSPEECKVKAVYGKKKSADQTNASDELVENLKSLIEMAKTIKGQKIDENKLSLIKLSILALNEIAISNLQTASREDFNSLKEIVGKLSDFIKNSNPDAQDLVAKFMNQFEIALRDYQGK